MIKLACCLPGGSFMPEGVKEVPTTPFESLMMKGRAIMDLGYDGVEATAGLLLQLTEEECDRVLSENKFPLITANSFIPPQYPIIGVDEEGKKALYDYADSVIRRLSYLHIPYIVFSSGGARRIPEGYDPAKAEAELDAFLAHCNETCGKYGVAVVSRVNLPYIRLLADGFHMGFNGENFEDTPTVTSSCTPTSPARRTATMPVPRAARRRPISSKTFTRQAMTAMSRSSAPSRISARKQRLPSNSSRAFCRRFNQTVPNNFIYIRRSTYDQNVL